MKLSSIVIATSFVWLLVAFWHRNELPRSVDFRPAILAAPKQTKTREKPFSAIYNGVSYRIEPQYDYELSGMIVSYRHHDGNSRMHLRAKDHLNMLDVCVIWGDNTANERLHKIDFWNGIFTCNVKTRDQAAWDSFDMNQLSNNHLISDDEYIRDRVSAVRVGDQIRVRGWLASYTGPVGTRGTSTTRTDTGDGACETIYVQGFEILDAATSYWRLSMYASLTLLIGGLIVHFRRPYRPFENG